MRKATGASNGTCALTFAAADAPHIPKIAGWTIHSIVPYHATNTSYMSCTIANGAGTVAKFNWQYEKVWLKELGFYIPMASAADTLTVTVAGGGGTESVTLMVEASPVAG